jgi:hypothetical protein
MKIRALRSRLVLAFATMAALVIAAGTARAEDRDPWTPGSQWISFRGGYVRNLDQRGANGNVGYGVAYGRMVSRRLMLGGSVDHNLLGRFGPASQIEVPVSVEALWHYRWKAPVSPFFGFGFAAVFNKTYRTGDDSSDIQPSTFFAIGLNTPIDHNSLLGVHVRLSSVSSDAEYDNPAFGGFKPSTGRISAKLAWTRAYW